MKKTIFILILAYLPIAVFSQSIQPFVINSAGGEGSVGGTQLYFNVGEPVISTISNSNNIITQGFLQPAYSQFNLLATYTVNNVSCIGKNDGSIIIQKAHTGISPQNLSYQLFWSDTLCPAHDCDMLNNLPPGTYSVMIIAYNGSTPIDTFNVTNLTISPSTEPCKVHVFNYLTPNGDGQNDIFYLENIEQYPDNIVYIFSRWGQTITTIKGYDNQKNAWGSDKHPINLASGTYFYLIDLDGKNTSLIKGFIEVIKN